MDLYPEYFPSSMKSNFSNTSPAIMESIDNPSFILNVNQSTACNKNVNISDIVSHLECSKLDVDNVNLLEKKENLCESFLLINEKEHLKVSKINT